MNQSIHSIDNNNKQTNNLRQTRNNITNNMQTTTIGNVGESNVSPVDRKNLKEMSVSLRRLKRQMFLRAVEQPVTPVDNLRNVFLNLAMDKNNSSESDMESMASLSSRSLLNESLSSIAE